MPKKKEKAEFSLNFSGWFRPYRTSLNATGLVLTPCAKHAGHLKCEITSGRIKDANWERRLILGGKFEGRLLPHLIPLYISCNFPRLRASAPAVFSRDLKSCGAPGHFGPDIYKLGFLSSRSSVSAEGGIHDKAHSAWLSVNVLLSIKQEHRFILTFTALEPTNAWTVSPFTYTHTHQSTVWPHTSDWRVFLSFSWLLTLQIVAQGMETMNKHM